MGCINKDLEQFSQEIRAMNREQFIEQVIEEEVIPMDISRARNTNTKNNKLSRTNGNKRINPFRNNPTPFFCTKEPVDERKRFKRDFDVDTVNDIENNEFGSVEHEYAIFAKSVKRDIHEKRENGRIMHFPYREMME